jgi:penicillin-binding protein 2
LARVEERRPDLPGIVIMNETRREYKYGPLGFHAIGYVGEISEQELALRSKEYKTGDVIGQAGVERVYDHYLKGRSGWRHIEVDALGRQVGVLGDEAPWPGHNIVLSLDRRLQEETEKILQPYKGAIILEQVNTGEILALASSPGYDPNLFARGHSRKAWEKLCRDRNYPLTNRAIQGLYPPGSIFKIATLLTALEENLVQPLQRFLCTGTYWISTWPYRCWENRGHGYVDAKRAIIESCDIYFYQLGLRITVDRLGKWAKDFGLGRMSGVDLPDESSGLVPSAQWKERTQNMPWFPGNTVMLSIGQGYILSTPLQMLNLIVAVANRGVIYRPHLLKRVVSIISREPRVIHEVKPEAIHRIQARAENWELLERALTEVVNSRRGTGRAARIMGYRIAGKTATAQNPHGEDHAGFVAYGPVPNPEVAVVVYLENVGGGGTHAAPLARAVMEAYFNAKK